MTTPPSVRHKSSHSPHRTPATELHFAADSTSVTCSYRYAMSSEDGAAEALPSPARRAAPRNPGWAARVRDGTLGSGAWPTPASAPLYTTRV